VGNRGRALARAALATGEVDIVAFADPHAPSREAFTTVVPTACGFERAEDVLALREVEAVLVATPNHQHIELVLAALDAGLHVLCEKPLAPTIEEIELIASRARQANRIVQVGMELRYSPLFNTLHRLVQEGCVGMPKVLWCHEFRPPFKPGVGGWRLDAATSGGTLLEKNCHHFDLFNWFTSSRPRRVHAVGSNDTLYADREMLDRAWVTVEYASGAQASLGLALFFGHEEQLEVGVLGTDGKLTANEPPGSLMLESTPRQKREQFPTPAGFAHGGEVEQQRAFARSIRTGEPPLADVEAAKWSHAVSLAAQLSIERGQPVGIDAHAHLA
jgi:myo-inositol 2-dehydrogenase / D-chiro-inositol 1-dehydrogenase